MSFSHDGGGGNPSSARWGVPYPVLMGGTPSSHGAGTNPHLGWGDTIPGMGWVGVPHSSSWLSTLARGYLPWLGGYLPWLGGRTLDRRVPHPMWIPTVREFTPYLGYIPLPPHLP